MDLPTVTSGPSIEHDEPDWEPNAGPIEAPPLDHGYAGWALGFAIVGLLVSLFVGWGIIIGVVAIITGILALRHPRDSRAVAIWALVLASASVVYSLGWLAYAVIQMS
ncbi:hypothetical protein [Microbacterium sediminicola]|uniref:hypothetical protein n=1 Tax=Microbacterium sediminicola TaxID=415210 RepID=UPI0031DCCDA2